ncbi:similar to Saccharomyces cerevisiae YDL006W PTC1 Type 2C protein phosphatase (PP2C) [Maudiozyma barnettii]|uniref:Similar to Saccharomyces cerevisiae YDL006W PTC1 Type 2C protein phosphatase (PP2C) n=1 Tax=Maudiozyma barnettii TaxID=61262 RepID=A0A8H2VE22_9SACH|nr:type 2C protein phosphatase PTC1 [Kazachstania barnettii]CAB4253171.1 similar to Saccharomyces cerevisiae YDL006W PTC1 Type 2C protein phosphatase (PP2C) [Kazachstania barnettii]CAD1780293.1 similar to Saccharomyces cerevisiae YDL006W PTC1 Type 2C protein phosphatase (PP2C) [Kazachstania barnettii]
MISTKQDRGECPQVESIATSNSTIEDTGNIHSPLKSTTSRSSATSTDSGCDVTYRVGVAENTNLKFRRSMEDVHTYVKNFASRLDWGYFAIFDGHAGIQASEWCGSHLHTMIEKEILEDETKDIREILNDSFVQIDKQINTKLEGNSGCTAAVCVLRWELPDENELESKVMSLDQHKRKLYTANVGDSRIVLFRNGNSIRLTYDHKASDILELQRVEAAGGLIMKSRVNGMLAVTRSLGDKFFDTLVIGNPFTTSVEITTEDKFLIIACDGLWDVIDDQEACELIQDIDDPDEAASILVKYALDNGTTDNITVMVVLLS